MLGLVAEPGEGVAQVVELPELLVDIGEACVEEVADVAAGRLAVVADVEDLLDLGEGESSGLAAVDEVDSGA
ncbi:hypothetical protein JOE53_002723 [Microbacterium laevaniformans]|nr:hypothetical protein [Microbacterium laevaniformans]